MHNPLLSGRSGLPVLLLLASCAGVPATIAAPPPKNSRVQHVVLITVDGLRPDAIAAAPARNIQQLMKQSAASLNARTTGTPETLPSHTSMVTGLPPDQHGVTYNTDKGDRLDTPSIFTRVQEAGGKTALLFGKAKMIMLAGPQGADTAQGPGPGESDWDAGADRRLAARFAEEFPKQRFMLSMIHLRDPDYIGHKQGWMSAPYLAAVRESDAAVGIILKAIAGSGLAKKTAVLLTADHGGEGDRHWSESELSLVIPWLCRAPGVKPASITGTPRTVDVAPTVLAWLGLPPLPGIDGKAVRACLP